MRYQRAALIPEAQHDTIAHVVAHISACCSETDNPNELADLVQVEITGIEGKSESVMITGVLEGYDAKAAYLDITRDTAQEPAGNQLAKIHAPVDLSPSELQEHLIRKAQR